MNIGTILSYPTNRQRKILDKGIHGVSIRLTLANRRSAGCQDKGCLGQLAEFDDR